MWQKTLPKVDILTSNCRVFMSSRVAPLAFFVASTVACIVQNTAVMSAELRIYQKPEFKRLRQIITVSAGNLCDDTSCSQLVFSEMVGNPSRGIGLCRRTGEDRLLRRRQLHGQSGRCEHERRTDPRLCGVRDGQGHRVFCRAGDLDDNGAQDEQRLCVVK
ncbi:hypothetical protein PF008_g20315 [Phytophthora fragariae]|uniref:Uncharacterized protein n=1 Tax=Phytophthora fragariae TaxID=53985 RepID=A0A6G0R133_9STRA|nr:hypothetical protein PF008_g20315 [Phytophthora fragariae]